MTRPRPRRRRTALSLVTLVAVGGAAVLAQVPVQRPPQGQGAAPAVLQTALIAGVLVEAGTGYPVEGVRVSLSGSELRGNRSAMTNDDGYFVLPNLPAGRHTLSASKAGYVTVVYGQQEPGNGRAGTPIQLLAGQQLDDLKFSIPRGGVVTGTVFDEKGRPSVATQVRASRWSMQTGERRLVSARTATTDDRGIYRIYGLAPGSYLVSAQPRNTSTTVNIAAATALEDRLQAVQLASGSAAVFSFTAGDGSVTMHTTDDAEAVDGYAPVYYPSTLDVSAALDVHVGVSETRPSIDLNLTRVPMARVQGSVMIPPGVSMSNTRVRLINTGLQAPGVSAPSARAGRDGTFRFPAVPPGQYVAVAVVSVRNPPVQAISAMLGNEPMPAGNTSIRFWARAEVSVQGQPIDNLRLVMQPGVAVAGQVLFEGAATPPPDNLSRVRLTISPLGQQSTAMGAAAVSANLDPTGRFRFLGVVPGSYRIRARSGVGGWWAKSAVANGIDTLDFQMVVPENDNLNNVVLTLSDQSAEIRGMLQNTQAQPTADYTVIVFPVDSRYWVPQSRRIASARPATDGSFSFTALPAGDYRLAAVTAVEPGIWYDPDFLRQLAAVSIPLTLGEGERKLQNLRVQGQ